MSRLPAFFICLLYQIGANAQHNDTLFLKSGHIRVVTVRQHDEKTLKYERTGRRGETVEKRVRLKRLKAFVIYDEHGNLVRDSRNPK